MESSPTDTPWVSLLLDVAEEHKELFCALLLTRGAQGIHEDHPGLHFTEGEDLYVTDEWTVPEPSNPTDRVELRAWFQGEAEPPGILVQLKHSAIEAGDPEFQIRVERPEQRDWSAAWKEGWSVTPLCRSLLVVPEWLDVPALEPGQQALILDPGMAFGTGTHETTMLCAELLEERLERAPGASILDIGTGTGILAIAGLFLGGGRALGLDTDPAAVEVARATAERNGVADRFVVRCGSAGDTPELWDIVLGNLLAPVIVALAADLAARTHPAGHLIVSGILLHQVPAVCTALEAEGMALAERRDLADWAALRFVHREAE